MACIIEDNNPIDSILGCTDPLALNYFSGATIDDGSCFYEGDTILGCTDPLALNYNPFANLDNGKICEYEDCPKKVTIRPTDGAVFYTSTGTPPDGGGNGDGDIIIIEVEANTNERGQAPQQPPQSVPLSEFCCTERIVGEPVTWDPELQLCIVNQGISCPEPLAVTLNGVIIGFDGNPVNEDCCNQIDTGEWDPNFILSSGDGNRLAAPRGACIDTGFSPAADCDLNFSDLNLNSDGTVTYDQVIVDTGGTGSDAESDPGGTGGDDTGTGGTGNDPIFCVSISDWGLVNPYTSYGNTYASYSQDTAFLYLDTLNIGSLSIGQQIELTGFNTNPATTCWGITSPSNFNGLVVTILDIIDLTSTFGVYSIITDLDLTTFFNNNNCTPGTAEIIEEFAQVCIVYTEEGGNGTGGGGSGTSDCFRITNFNEAAFIKPQELASAGTIDSNWYNNCNTNYNQNNYYLSIIDVDDPISIQECGIYYLNEVFWIKLSNSCWAPYVDSGFAGGNVFSQFTVNDLAQIPVTIVRKENGIIFLDLSITQQEHNQVINNPQCLDDDISILGKFSFCDPTRSFQGGGNRSAQNNQNTLDCTISNSFEFQRLGFLGANVLGDPNYITWCNEQGLNENDWYLVVVVDPNDISSMVECQEYSFSQVFVDALSNSCWGQPWSYQKEVLGGNQIIVNGQLQIPQNNSMKLLKTGVYNNQGLAIFKVSLPDQAGGSISNQRCGTIRVDGGFELCTSGVEASSKRIPASGAESDPNLELNGTEIPPSSESQPNNTEVIVSNLSEDCCEELGNGLWTYLNGVCYWKPPPVPQDVSIGISENDVIVTDPRCNNLKVCLSLFFELPDDPACYNSNISTITGNLGFYSGGTPIHNLTNGLDFNVNQLSTFNSEIDGLCTWVELCAEIVDYDGTPFRIKLDLQGVLDCCEYDIFVDDISVSCTIQDSIEVSTKNSCPGFTLNKVIDNKKSWVYNDGSNVINRIFAPSEDADIPWRYTNYLEQSGVLEKHSKLVLNSKELYLTFNMCDLDNCCVEYEPCPNGYIFDEASNNCYTTVLSCPNGYTLSGGTCYSGSTTASTTTSIVTQETGSYCVDRGIGNIFELIKYKNNFQNFWVKFIEQFVPATTIFISGEKWCTKPEQICKTYDDCNYDNSLNNLDLGLFERSSTTNGANNKNSGNNGDVYNGEDSLSYSRTGDYGDNKSDGPIIFGDNFFGVFITDDPSTIEEELTFPKGLVPLLEKGMGDFRNRMKTPTTRRARV